jgi:hypothetical protein
MFKQYILVFSLILFSYSCGVSENSTMEKHNKEPLSDSKNILGGILVEHPFTSKNGETSEIMELYLRCSVQDYFIKFCESEVTPDQLKPFLDKSVTLEIEMKDGEWDNCLTEDLHVQSRTGKYLAVKGIVN